LSIKREGSIYEKQDATDMFVDLFSFHRNLDGR
jgi:hypothetical protein